MEDAVPTMVQGAGGATIVAYDFGGDGPPLLLAHATGFHAHTLLPMARHLGRAFRCFAFDERGHGASPVPTDGDFDWHRFADDALAVVDALGLIAPVAFGHSCGGALLLLAEQHRPGTWRELFLYEPVIPPTEGSTGPAPDAAAPANPLAAGAMRRRATFPSVDRAIAHFAAKPPLDVLDPGALRAYVEHGFVPADGSITLACRPESEAATYRAATRHRAWDRLGAVACPTTIACGSASSSFPVELMELAAARLPKGRSVVFDGLGHFGPLQDPGRVSDTVAQILSASHEDPPGSP